MYFFIFLLKNYIKKNQILKNELDELKNEFDQKLESLLKLKQNQDETTIEALNNSLEMFKTILPNRIETFNQLGPDVSKIESDLLSIEQWILYQDTKSKMVIYFYFIKKNL